MAGPAGIRVRRLLGAAVHREGSAWGLPVDPRPWVDPGRRPDRRDRSTGPRPDCCCDVPRADHRALAAAAPARGRGVAAARVRAGATVRRQPGVRRGAVRAPGIEEEAPYPIVMAVN